MAEVPPEATVLPAGDVNDNDKLMAALSYLFTPIVPIIVLLVETMKVRPYQRYHAIQSLGFFGGIMVFIVLACVVTTVCGFLLTLTGVGALLVPCLSLLFFLPIIPGLYYTYLAYAKPAYFEIPVVTKFMKQQGWLSL